MINGSTTGSPLPIWIPLFAYYSGQRGPVSSPALADGQLAMSYHDNYFNYFLELLQTKVRHRVGDVIDDGRGVASDHIIYRL